MCVSAAYPAYGQISQAFPQPPPLIPQQQREGETHITHTHTHTHAHTHTESFMELLTFDSLTSYPEQIPEGAAMAMSMKDKRENTLGSGRDHTHTQTHTHTPPHTHTHTYTHTTTTTHRPPPTGVASVCVLVVCAFSRGIPLFDFLRCFGVLLLLVQEYVVLVRGWLIYHL